NDAPGGDAMAQEALAVMAFVTSGASSALRAVVLTGVVTAAAGFPVAPRAARGAAESASGLSRVTAPAMANATVAAKATATTLRRFIRRSCCRLRGSSVVLERVSPRARAPGRATMGESRDSHGILAHLHIWDT